jgi:hypothetical protein
MSTHFNRVIINEARSWQILQRSSKEISLKVGKNQDAAVSFQLGD